MKLLRDALNDFIRFKLVDEATGVAADLARVHFPDRSKVRDFLEEISATLRRLAPAAGPHLLAIETAADDSSPPDAEAVLDEAITTFRASVDDRPGVIPCFLT